MERKTKWEELPNGDLQEVDTDTGEVLTYQPAKRKKRKPKGTEETHHWVQMPDGKKYWVPKGTNPDTLPHKVWPVSAAMDEQILALVAQGKTLTWIGKQVGFPPASTIYNWLARRPDFHTLYEKMQKIAGHALRDQAIDAAEEVDPKSAYAQKVKHDIYKWGAQVANPSSYGTKVQQQVDHTVKGFVVVTGVPQIGQSGIEPLPDTGEIEVESTPVSSEDAE